MRALISVSDKTGLVELGKELPKVGYNIILSTGGTASALRAGGVQVTDVSDYTRLPEMMDGRLKTLHHKVHGGILNIRSNTEHQQAMRRYRIKPIDMVVVNLYPFRETIAQQDT